MVKRYLNGRVMGHQEGENRGKESTNLLLWISPGSVIQEMYIKKYSSLQIDTSKRAQKVPSNHLRATADFLNHLKKRG